jgi:hypothetical protein
MTIRTYRDVTFPFDTEMVDGPTQLWRVVRNAR